MADSSITGLVLPENTAVSDMEGVAVQKWCQNEFD